jgi:hypothetical protein
LQQHRPRALDEESAGGRAPGFDRPAVEQPQPEFAFGRLDAAAEGRLAQMNAVGRTTEMTLVGEGHDVLKATQVHGNALTALILDRQCIGRQYLKVK